MKRNILILTVLVVLVLLAAGASFGMRKWRSYERKKEKAFDDKIAVLQKQISALGESLGAISTTTPQVVLPQKEIIYRETIREKSQDQLLTEAVARVAPAVVSIVVSKDVPLLEIVYENPFGDDPFFRDFGFLVPRYRQKGTQKQKVGAGTGFLISRDGFIVTNRHVVEDTQAEYMVLLANGQQKIANVVFRDASLDLAILKISGSNFAFVNLGDSDNLQLGQTVIAIGNALGEYNNSVSTGIISGLNRTVEALNSQGRLESLSGVIQTDAAINPGNSGGPLLTLDGQVVGINVATVQGAQSISFAIPVNMVKNTIRNVTGR